MRGIPSLGFINLSLNWHKHAILEKVKKKKKKKRKKQNELLPNTKQSI